MSRVRAYRSSRNNDGGAALVRNISASDIELHRGRPWTLSSGIDVCDRAEISLLRTVIEVRKNG